MLSFLFSSLLMNFCCFIFFSNVSQASNVVCRFRIKILKIESFVVSKFFFWLCHQRWHPKKFLTINWNSVLPRKRRNRLSHLSVSSHYRHRLIGDYDVVGFPIIDMMIERVLWFFGNFSHIQVDGWLSLLRVQISSALIHLEVPMALSILQLVWH